MTPNCVTFLSCRLTVRQSFSWQSPATITVAAMPDTDALAHKKQKASGRPIDEKVLGFMVFRVKVLCIVMSVLL